MGNGAAAERAGIAVPWYLGGRASGVELPGGLEIRAGGSASAAAAAEEAEEDPSSGRRGLRRAHGRGAEEVLEDGHGEEHGDEHGRGDEAEGDRADAAVQLPPPHLLLLLRPRPWPPPGRRSHRRAARHGARARKLARLLAPHRQRQHRPPPVGCSSVCLTTRAAPLLPLPGFSSL